MVGVRTGASGLVYKGGLPQKKSYLPLAFIGGLFSLSEAFVSSELCLPQPPFLADLSRYLSSGENKRFTSLDSAVCPRELRSPRSRNLEAHFAVDSGTFNGLIYRLAIHIYAQNASSVRSFRAVKGL